MPKVTIQPLDIEVEAPEGATIMGAAQAQGYYWPTTCGGEGRCTTCPCLGLSGMESLSPRGRSEGGVTIALQGGNFHDQLRRAAKNGVADGHTEVEKAGV